MSLRVYFLRHWRGDLPLKSYFIGAILPTLALPLIGLAFVLGARWYGSSQALGGAIIILWASVSVAVGWYCVGAWRGARKALGLPAERMTARVTQGGLIVLLLFFALALVQAGFPQIKVAADLLTWGPKPYVLQVLASNQVISIKGRITFGLAKDLKKVLDRNPKLNKVYLDSPGGKGDEAKRVYDLIAERGLATYAVGKCYSACVIILMGGRERFLVEGATIGLHRPTAPGKGPGIFGDSAVVAYERAYLDNLGIGASLIQRAMEVPPDQIWRPTTEELIVGNVITGVVQGSGIYGTKPTARL